MRLSRQAAPTIALCAIMVASCGTAAPQRRPAATIVPASRLFSQAPEVGVACPIASSIACDRVGVAVWLTPPTLRVSARIEGIRLVLAPPRSRGGWWEGYLQPAGLIDGPLRVTPDSGRYIWRGSHPRDAHVVVTVVRRSGDSERAAVTVPLRPGWG